MSEKREDDCGEHEYTLSKTCVYCGHWESLSPLYEMVKREKIEFWRKELLNKTDEVLKSMREVLGIE